ncbi:flavin reductase family protein [Actinokineospora sp.]|uniref:flavin reductase family protein n=1 Tax=Actinokineospora sp. TaxID=1872133 RepID=UPI003D6C0F96
MQFTRSPLPDQAAFRDVLGHYCSGVTVITAMDGDEPVGFACQSFQSLSLDPPMVSFAPAKTSTTWPRIRRAGWFAASVLAEGQHDLCRQFAVSGGDKFAGVAWRPGPSGSPRLDGALAWVECEIVGEVEAGDHVIVLGQVLDLASSAGSRPLLFYRGKFGALAD